MAKAQRMRLIACAVVALLAACGRPAEQEVAAPAPEPSTGDLGDIVESGRLRVLLGRSQETYLPRHGAGLYAERELAEQFAGRLGIEAELVFVDSFSDLLPALLDGRGDLAASNLTVTDARRARVNFTRPLRYSRDRLVVAAGRAVPGEQDALAGTVAARRGTTLLDSARQLAAEHAALEVVAVDDSLTNDALVDMLADGEFDYVIQDGNVLETMLDYRDDIAAGPAVTEPRPLAWAVRPDNPELLAALNDFIAEYRLLGGSDTRYIADLPELRERRRLRMITRNNAATYFLWRGELLGFEYELGKRFAETEKLRLEVVVAPSHADMIPMLLRGEGDLIAAYLVPTEARVAQGVTFTRPYHYASEVVIGRVDEEAVESLAGLAGRSIAVRRSSSYWTHLEELIGAGELDVELIAAPPDMETQEIIDAVAAGRFDLTVADSHILDVELTWRDDIRSLLSIGEERPHGWAVHPQNVELLAAMNAFFDKAYRGLFYNIRYQKYFENPRHAREEPAELLAPGRLSPYDELVRAYAERYSFDWRLIVAQMYRESRFNPSARSWMGAVGLMQVLPRTAKEFGFEDLRNPETGIHAGIRYLDWVRDRFPRRLDPGERTWFALAGYNAGHGHVRDARRLARELGLDPDRWFDNVELAMLKLSEPEYAQRARHGYVRGSEPVQYVREIRERYQAYTRLLAQAPPLVTTGQPQQALTSRP